MGLRNFINNSVFCVRMVNIAELNMLGGNFEDGFVTGVFSRAFNDAAHRKFTPRYRGTSAEVVGRRSHTMYVKASSVAGIPDGLNPFSKGGPMIAYEAGSNSLYMEYSVLETDHQIYDVWSDQTVTSHEGDSGAIVLEGVRTVDFKLESNFYTNFSVNFLGFVGASHIRSSNIRPPSCINSPQHCY